jgi:hypothetical protein
VTDQAEIPDTAIVVWFMSIELPDCSASPAPPTPALKALARGARQRTHPRRPVAGGRQPSRADRALEVIRNDWAIVDAAAAVTDRAIAVHLGRGADFDDPDDRRNASIGLRLCWKARRIRQRSKP